jgi:hypothetical protein
MGSSEASEWDYVANMGTTGAMMTPHKAAAYGELVAKTAAIVSNIMEAIDTASIPEHTGQYLVGANSLFVKEIR